MILTALISILILGILIVAFLLLLMGWLQARATERAWVEFNKEHERFMKSISSNG